MDVAAEKDLKLQRRATELLAGLERGLPRLLFKGRDRLNARSVVRGRDVDALVGLLEPFQEWPQLLDPHLPKLLPLAIEAFIVQLGRSAHGQKEVKRVPVASSTSARFAICKILYVFCKIRGHKVVSRFFSNEADHLEMGLNAYRNWDACSNSRDGELLSWEERYIGFLWLSHLLLVPFDIKSITSAMDTITHASKRLELPRDVPSAAVDLLSIGLRYVAVAGKERESAQRMLVRLSVRKDMIHAGLLACLINRTLVHIDTGTDMSIYERVGMLSYLASVLNAAEFDAISEFIPAIFRTAQRVAIDDSDFFVETRSSALARKATIKLFRALFTVALRSPDQDPVRSVISLEDVIEYLLGSLQDTDTPVRYAASKAISIITLKLEPDLAQDVIEAMLASLRENVDDHVFGAGPNANRPISDVADRFKAADPLQWHGLILSVAQLLLQRCPPPSQLPRITNYLFLALQFEQRSSTGTSVGGNVRDAACFGIWALVRRYTTAELQLATNVQSSYSGRSVPQTIAIELILAACLDPIGNIRRGASASLQELIGRHQDTISVGITVVQIVSYQAVALHTRAVNQVAVDVSELASIYWDPLFLALMGWRGLGSPAIRSRRAAAKAIGSMSTTGGSSRSRTRDMMGTMVQVLRSLQPRQAEHRHGVLLSLSAIVDARYAILSAEPDPEGNADTLATDEHVLSTSLAALNVLTVEELTVPSLRPDLIAEGACRLISSLEPALRRRRRRSTAVSPDICSHVRRRSVAMLELALMRRNEELLEPTTRAAWTIVSVSPQEDRAKLIEGWLSRLQPSGDAQWAGTGRHVPYLHALGSVYLVVQEDQPDGSGDAAAIVQTLARIAKDSDSVELRVAAIQSLARGVLKRLGTSDELVNVVAASLDDYAIDSRGDIGSVARLAAIEAVVAILAAQPTKGDLTPIVLDQRLISRVTRLAVERVDKVRIRAADCLRQALISIDATLADVMPVEDAHHASSRAYFSNILHILANEQLSCLHIPLLEGFVTSAGAGSESILQASRQALIEFCQQTASFVTKDLLPSFTIILSNHPSNDRIAVPTLESLAVVLNANVMDLPAITRREKALIFNAVQMCHYKSKNMSKLEAAIKVYFGLALVPDLRDDCLRKLTNLLLHPYPRIRVSAAEALYTLIHLESNNKTVNNRMAAIDWSLPPQRLENDVHYIRARLRKGRDQCITSTEVF